MSQRIGFGFDVHSLKDGLPLFIGGINIPHQKGALGHSDADTLIHAICDSLLGAAALGDIGSHFPDTDEKYKGIDSTILLDKTCKLLISNGYRIVNIDCTVCLQKPKLLSHIPAIINRLSEVMSISCDVISVKAKTSEKLGFVGREEGISAYAVVLIEKG
jgi:2-C-methyl-D-erythritol 2,4-cyclodiphosphate synthase